ncbi:aminodeoxychorismate lyase [Robertmurraya beringensis]|uniref:Aminodeoxychorismate lyase n=1 Tax=Robertmurraya beringensis TaxID=641660 RepID=A0ABV6KKE0_9BACI
MYLYMNGEMIQEEEARISPFDHGFLYGMGIFETFRVYDGHPFLLEDHLERLNSSLTMIGIQKIINKDEVIQALKLLLEKNQLSNAYIRLNVSAGVGAVGLPVEPYEHANVMMFVKPLPEAGGPIEKEAQFLKLSRNTPEGSMRLKSHHYMNNLLAKKEIGNRTDVEGIFLTQDGCIAEGIVSNIFWVIDNQLFTPDLDTGILNGITRSFTIELARKKGLQVQEGFYKPDVLDKATEIFVTNSIQEIVAISKFNSLVLPGVKGELFQMLHQAYRLYTHSLWSRKEIK